MPSDPARRDDPRTPDLDTVLAFQYHPSTRVDPASERLSVVLAELFGELKPGHAGRVVIEVTAKGCRRWLLLHLEGESGDVTYQSVLSRLRDAGLVGELASAKSVQRLMGDFPRPIRGSGQHVADQEGRCVVTLNVRQLGDVTQPGMTRALVVWLRQRDYPGYLVMDFHHAGHGVGRCDLALVLTARTDLEGQRAAQEAEVLMFEGLGAVVEQDACRQAVLRTLKRLLPGSRARARLLACAGNIADLFPV